VITDNPTAEEWKTKISAKLAEVMERSILAKTVSEIAAEKFPKNSEVLHLPLNWQTRNLSRKGS
jgi:hypothetical protein